MGKDSWIFRLTGGEIGGDDMRRDLLKADIYGFREICLEYGIAMEIERTLQLIVLE